MIDAIVNSIAVQLDSEFGHPVHTDKIKQGFKEPCFYIKVLDPSQNQLVGNTYRKVVPLDIHYFGSNPQTIADSLYEKLEYLSSEDMVFHATDTNHRVTGGVLHFFATYKFNVMKQVIPDDNMGTLAVDVG